MSDSQPPTRRISSRAWRIAFVCYALALTVGTHWPQLRVDTGIPGNDKTIHVVAFGGLTALLWCTGWFRLPWLAGLVALVWSILDEISQGIPILNRSVHLDDAIANAAGVLIATLAIVAVRQVKSRASRLNV